MRFDPAIAKLRGDRAPQARAQAAMVAACEAWRGEQHVAPALAELDRFGRGGALDDCPALLAIFTCQENAGRVAASLVDHFSRTLMETPLGHPPFRHGFDGRASTLLLARSGRAQLLLQAREPGVSEFAHVSFADALRYEAVLAGKAKAVIVRRSDPPAPDAGERTAHLYEESMGLGAGARLALDRTSEALLVERVERRLVTLRLHRTAKEPRPTEEFDRATGVLRHLSCGDLVTSRQEMLVTLLGRMKRAEAAPVLTGMAREAGDDSLRWQALREGLALDTASGIGALCDIASRPGDPLAAQAGALRAQLIETFPQLRDLETGRCPA